MICHPRRNSLAQNSLSRNAADHERSKRDGQQCVLGHCGRPETRESLHFSTCTAPACQAIGTQLGARPRSRTPNDSPRIDSDVFSVPGTQDAETVSPGVFGVPGQLPVEVLGTTGYY